MTIACVALRDAGLDSIQLSFQSDESSLADEIAGARAHERKLDVAAKIRAAGIPLSLNFVIHRRNIDRLPQMIDLAEALGAERVELANVQFYGWAFRNRAALLPTREQVDRARDIATAAKARLAGKIDIFYVLPDYYETRPKPCLNGWGQRYLTVNPIGDVLPCPTASSAIPDLRLENVRARDLDWIWRESESFNRFRGTEWMPEPCQSCPQREIDFGGCRCQAALLTGNAANTDPVCEFSPNRALVDAVLREINSCKPTARLDIPSQSKAVASEFEQSITLKFQTRYSGERTRPACWRWRPRHRGLFFRSLSSESAMNARKDCFGVDAETSTRDACAPQNRHASSRALGARRRSRTLPRCYVRPRSRRWLAWP